jgi:hypothetical protein
MTKINRLFPLCIFYVLSIVFITACEVTDEAGDSGGGSNTKPVAHMVINEPSNMTIGSIVTFDASTSSDADGDSLLYHWSIISQPQDSLVNLSSLIDETPTLTIDAYGTYTVRLVASDSLLDSDPDLVTFTVIKQTLLEEFDFENNSSPEFTGDWKVGTNSTHSGTHSLQAPQFESSGTASTEIAFTQSHTQISFWHSNRFAPFNLYIDDVLYRTYKSYTASFEKVLISVPEGSHTYRWEITSAGSGTPAAYIDDISFSHIAPVSNTTGPYGFEEGFFTQEITGDWVIDNVKARDGSSSIRAPYFASAGTASTEIAFIQSHTQISFWHSNRFAPFNLYIDDVLYRTYKSYTASFEKVLISVPEGSHTYRWEITTAGSGIPEAYIDDISFSHIAPVSNTTGPYGFEEGFFTQEITGDWVIDNVKARDGSSSIRAPYFASAGTASTEIAFTQSHTQISFWHSNRFAPFNLYIDDVLYRTYKSYTASFEKVLISVPEGSHTYRWEITTAGSGIPEAYIDDISFL